MTRAADDSKRRNIRETAFRTFGELGFRATTIKRIAERAGIAPGSVYTYFRDKDHLFQSTVEHGWDSFLSRLEEIRASPRPFEEKLHALVETGFGVLKENLPLMRGMLFEASQRKLFQVKLDKVCQSVEKLIREGMPLGARSDRFGPSPPPRGSWRKLLKIVVVGILFSAASAQPDRTDREIRGLRDAVRARIDEILARRRMP